MFLYNICSAKNLAAGRSSESRCTARDPRTRWRIARQLGKALATRLQESWCRLRCTMVPALRILCLRVESDDLVGVQCHTGGYCKDTYGKAGRQAGRQAAMSSLHSAFFFIVLVYAHT